MKIVSSADWRDALPFDLPILVAEVAPGEPTRCTICGTASDPRPRTELWAVKHRHPKNHSGFIRFYCADHRPVPPPPPTPEPIIRARAAAARRERSTTTPRVAKPVVPERQRATCPNCFVEVSAAGECGMCGWES